MENQIYTSGGASIHGDASPGRDFIGRDKNDTTINNYNLTIVGQFLHFAEVEKLLPKITQMESFTTLLQSLESNQQSSENSDLIRAVAFVGEVIGDFLSPFIERSGKKPIVLSLVLKGLVDHIGKKLSSTGHWKAFCQTGERIGDEILWLETTSLLFAKYFKSITPFGIRKEHKSYKLITPSDYGIGPVELTLTKLNTKQLRILIAGIVLDLIRLESDVAITTQFLQGFTDIFSTSQNN